MKLTIELVPSSSWYTNVRSNVTPEQWDIIRTKSRVAAANKCEICGDSGLNQGFHHPVECHEVWEYDDKKKMQKLVRLISLCPMCHKTKHIGLAQIQGFGDIVLEHLIKVNNISEAKAKKYIVSSFDTWFKRSEHEWTLDISYLDDYDYTVQSAADRLRELGFFNKK